MISIKKILIVFLVFSLFYYLSVITYASGFLGFSIGKRTVEEAASGSFIKQFTGLLVLALSILIIYFSRNIAITKVIKQNKAISILLLFIIGSVIWSVEPGVTTRRLIAFITLILTAVVLVYEFTPSSLLDFLWKLIFFIAFIGLIDNLATGVNLSFGFSDRENSLRGIFSDKNAAGRVYSYAFIIGFSLKGYKYNFGLFALAFLFLCILLSQSVSAFAMCIGGTGLVFVLNILRGREYLQNIIRFSVFLFISIVTVYFIQIFFEEILGLLGRDPTLTNRAIIWELLTPAIEQKPLLGYGFGAFWASDAASAFIERWGFIGNAHSGYFELLLHGGLIGLVVLIYALARVLMTLIKVHIKGNPLSSCYITLLLIMIVFNYTGYMILNHNSFDMFMFTIIVFSIGLANSKQQTKLDIMK